MQALDFSDVASLLSVTMRSGQAPVNAHWKPTQRLPNKTLCTHPASLHFRTCMTYLSTDFICRSPAAMLSRRTKAHPELYAAVGIAFLLLCWLTGYLHHRAAISGSYFGHVRAHEQGPRAYWRQHPPRAMGMRNTQGQIWPTIAEWYGNASEVGYSPYDFVPRPLYNGERKTRILFLLDFKDYLSTLR